jgi:pimeloyl-ACP methyl ester carboxylesterase
VLEVTSETNRISYDEFSMFHENAAEWGLPFDEPPTVARVETRLRDGRSLSTLRWGVGAPEVVLIHGGAQNAHTWDTVALALGRPLIAPDLPGHGHSDSPAGGVGTRPDANAADLAEVIDALAPKPSLVVGMSLGGLTAISLAAARPEFVPRLLLVDVTPGVTGDKAKAIHDFVRGPATFPSFDDLLARTMEFNPTRSESSLRRGILHNALQLDDGSWVWRHRRDDHTVMGDTVMGDTVMGDTDEPERGAEFAALWDDLEASPAPLTLVRGMREQSVIDDADVDELRRRRPDAIVVEVDAGHSVQGDQPIELAAIIEAAIDRGAV